MTHFPSRLRKSHLGLLLAAGLLSAPLRLAAPPAAAQTASSTSGKPTLIANSKKYKNTGEKPATGRAGSATLSARALLNKKDGDNRTTDLEVTTLAEFDTGATAPGNIDKVQFKPLDQNGNAIYAKNFTGLTGSGPFKAQANGLAHKQQLQVQGNISGIDPKRTGVVTVVANVVLRPDLSPTSLGAPAKTVVNTPVNISAVVTELNQDVGAKADAVLLVGGAEVDRARRIFVDAGGVVTAAFTHTFDSTGTKSVEVRVEGVTPGDYDAANNSKSATIEVVSSSNMSFGAYAEDLGFNHSGTWDNKGKDGSRNLVYDDVGEWAQSGWYQNARVDAWMPKAVTFPLSMKAVHKTGGPKW